MAGYIGSKASVVSSGAERKKTFTITGATTSLTGLNYTVGKVHVFQNGVRLVDGTDYTATNGTTITLTVAAQSGDNVVVISQASFQVADALLTSGGTMTGDLTVQGAFTSQGIDDNGNATALTIDSNENVLVGTTNDLPAISNVQGIALSAGSYGGRLEASRSGGAPVCFNRLENGSVVEIKKAGVTSGIIGAVGTQSYIHGGGTDVGIYFGSNNIYPYRQAGLNDATIDLGQSSKRFKDAYLSGGIYLGGTVAANKLDDFETGSFTPYFTSSGATPSLTYTTQGGTYVKVGNLVTIWIKLRINNISSAGSGNLRVAGLPFTVTDACAETGGSVGLWLSMASATGTEIIQQRSGGQQLFVLQNTTNGAHSVSAMANGGYLRCTTSYTTA
jgi:hypothetical protein